MGKSDGSVRDMDQTDIKVSCRYGSNRNMDQSPISQIGSFRNMVQPELWTTKIYGLVI